MNQLVALVIGAENVQNTERFAIVNRIDISPFRDQETDDFNKVFVSVLLDCESQKAIPSRLVFAFHAGAVVD